MKAFSSIPLVVAFAFFMEGLDGTVITTALPAMARDLGTTPVTLSAGISAYLVSLAVFIPVGGWMADRWGTSLAFRAAIIIFSAASVGCALAPTPVLFVVARIVQGLGGAMMVPVGRLIILRSFEKSEFVTAMSMVTTPALIGPLLGPLVGGFFATFFSWRWIFLINVPIGLIGVILATLWVRDARAETVRRFDWRGFILTAVAVGCFMTGIELLVGNDAFTWTIGLLLVAGLAAGVAAIRHARAVTAPLIDLTLFHIRTFRAANGWGAIFRGAVTATPFLLPLLFQVGFGMSAFSSGLLTFSAAIGAIAMKAAAPRILRRYGFRRVLAVNGAACGLTTLAFFATGASAIALIAAAVLDFGFTRSLELASLNALSFADVPATQQGPAASLASMLQQLVSAVGIAASALMLNVLLLGHAGRSAALDASDIRLGLLVTGFATVLSALAFYALDRNAGAEFSGHRDPAAAIPAASY